MAGYRAVSGGLGPEFFARTVHEVARELIGCTLQVGACSGRIVESESYTEDDPACHAYNGRTARNAPLFGPPGTAYVYRSYGIHNLLNFVAEPEGRAAAVLIRALEPLTGLDLMTKRRGGRPRQQLCAGPGRLTQALGVTLSENGLELGQGPLRLTAPDRRLDPAAIVSGPRIGISKAVDLPWRFCERGSRYVSAPRPYRLTGSA